jgi:Thermolysin metallopeptidase, alpha-helical domain
VHTNSGIPNRAFVLAAKAIGGKAWDVTGKIWYVTLTERLTAQADFVKCANETVSVARDLYPQDPSIAARVAKAWADVGVLGVSDTVASTFARPPVGVPRPAAVIAQAKPRHKRSKRA